MNRTMLLVLVLMAGCGVDRNVGNPNVTPRPPGETMTQTAVVMQNLVATVTRTFTCPAGAANENATPQGSCACDRTYTCDVDNPLRPEECSCDVDCIQPRPPPHLDVNCADYSFTFVLDNRSSRSIERITEFKVEADTLVATDAGNSCQSRDWTITPGDKTGVMEVSYSYDSGNDQMAASPLFRFRCNDGPSNGAWGPPLGPQESLPDAPTSGDIMLSLSGLLTDGTPFTSRGSANLQ